MAQTQVRVARVEWSAVFPAAALFRGFRMALQPSKLLLALLLVVVVYVGGMTLSALWGPTLDGLDAAALGMTAGGLEELRGTNLFGAFLNIEVDALRDLLTSAARLDFGLDADGTGVIPAAQRLFLGGPMLLWAASPGFTIVFLLGTLVATLLIGGALCRLAAAQCCGNGAVHAGTAASFVARKGVWLLMAPLLPVLLIVVLIAALAVLGLVTFNWPVLDIVGGLLFGVGLLAGLLLAVVAVGLLLAGPLMPAALAVEGTDAYDAVSRTVSYVTARPWHYGFYGVIALVYGAVTFLFVTAVVGLALYATVAALEVGVFRAWSAGEASRLQAALPVTLGLRDAHVSTPGGTLAVTGWLLSAWVKLVAALPVAYAVSYFFTATTWVYLLLRQSAEGSALDASEDPSLRVERAVDRTVLP